MQGKIIKNKELNEWKKKYGSKNNLEIISVSDAKKDPSKLDNKKWWLIGDKYYQVPKKKLIPLFCVLGTLTLAAGIVTPILCVKNCNKPTEVTISISPKPTKLIIGATENLHATVSPAEKQNEITWAIDDAGKSFVSLTETSGPDTVLQGIAKGSATITATIDGKSDSFTVSVDVPEISISISPKTINLGATDQQQLTATVTGTTEKPKWTSSNESIATVDENGYVIINSTISTSTTVTITATLPTSTKYDTCTINVQPTALKNFLTLENKDASQVAKVSWTICSSHPESTLYYTTEVPTETTKWEDFPSDYVYISPGQKIYLKGNLINETDGTDQNVILIEDGNVTLSGNIMNLLQDTNGLPPTKLTKPYQLAYLFSLSTSLTSIDQTNEKILPATNLSDNCYCGMFNYSGLVDIPNGLLPATTLTTGCYIEMFKGCEGLLSAPELPATTLANNCYKQMFYGCTSLKISQGEPTTQSKGTIFTCPDISALTEPVTDMFTDCSSSGFTGTPSEGNAYYWYKE